MNGILCLLFFLLVGCGLSKETRLAAEQTVASMNEAKASVANAERAFEERASNSPVPNLAVTMERERTREDFDAAKQSLERNGACMAKLAELLKLNRKRDEASLQSQTAICSQGTQNAKNSAAMPAETLERWERLTADATNERDAARTVMTEGRAFHALQFDTKGPLVTTLRERMRTYPAKQGDITSRMLDVKGELAAMEKALEATEAHVAALAKGTSEYDAANFERALAELSEANATMRAGTEDLTERAKELDESWSLVLSGLTRTCTFRLHHTKWEWGSETYSDGTPRDQGWAAVNENEWFSTAEDAVVASTGSDYYAGTQTEVDDKDIQCADTAVTYEIRNGIASDPITASIDEETFDGYYAAARSMHELFPDLGIITSMTLSKHTDPEDAPETGNPYSPIPVGVNVSAMLTIESKAKGQYEDEATESPAPQNVPVQHVGDPEYGAWGTDAAGEQYWYWNDFALGYLMAQNYNLSPYPYSAFVPYRDWRDNEGWDCQRGTRDQYGNCPRNAHAHGYYRRWYLNDYDADGSRAVPGNAANASRSVRGAGPSTRSRGMGGGGK